MSNKTPFEIGQQVLYDQQIPGQIPKLAKVVRYGKHEGRTVVDVNVIDDAGNFTGKRWGYIDQISELRSA